MTSCLVLAGLLVLLAALASCDQFITFSYCNNMEKYALPLALTMEGQQKMASFVGKKLNVVMWDENKRETAYTCATIEFNTPATFTYSYIDAGSPKTFTGTVKTMYTSTYYYMDLKFNKVAVTTEGLLGSGGGDVRMAPMYIGNGELILVACDNNIFGKRVATYVLSTESKLSFNATCGAAEVKALLPTLNLAKLHLIGQCATA